MDPVKIATMAADYTAAWNSKSPEAVAGFYAADGEIIINRGDPWSGRNRVRDMAAGFYRDVPDLSLSCDDVRTSESHALFLWTFTGHAAETGSPLKIHGWEEWDLNEDFKVQTSRGWFDAVAFQQQSES